MIITDEQSLSQFFDKHYQNAVIRSLRITNDQGSAEDIVMNCLMKLWNNRNEISVKGNVEPYFYKMVRNKSIDFVRNKKVVDFKDVPETTHVGNSLEEEELKNHIDNIIDELPERCRQIFVLSRFELMSNKAIAEQLELSVKTVENQMTKALKTLRNRIRPFLSIFLA